MDGPDTESRILHHPPGTAHRGGAKVRVVLGVVWLIGSLVQGPVLVGSTLVPLGFLVYGVVSLLLVHHAIAPTLRTYGLLVIDVAVLGALTYLHGSLHSDYPAFYICLIAAHTWERVPLAGPVAVGLAWLAMVTVYALEAWSVLPPHPGGVSGLTSDWPVLAAVGETWPMLTSMSGIHFIVLGSVRRTDAYVAQLRTLVEAEKDARLQAVRLREELVESQRLESLGRLAGGIAHDFNNLLTGIRGFTRLVHDDLDRGDPRREDLGEVIRAAETASELTAQLLAIGRKQVVRLRRLRVNELVEGLERMLSRTLGEDIQLEVRLDRHAGAIVADPTQLEQVVVNLAVNARDAMPVGGVLTLGTERRTLDSADCGVLGVSQPGDYVLLTVSDTGVGIDQDVMEHIFDPFFTTKERGKGTGLGLATVYGIVHQNGGAITVESTPGVGTTFQVYWPGTQEAVSEVPAARAPAPSGHETVLLVEDEEMVRDLAARILEKAGYQVVGAAGGEEALDVLQAMASPPALLLTDVVMPGMSGAELAERVVARLPRIRVVFLSGHAPELVDQHGALKTGASLLSKPFSVADLLGTVRRELDRVA